MVSVRFHGRGLHTGAECGLVLRRSSSEVGFEHRGRLLRRDELELVRSDQGVRLGHRETEFELELVEHLFAALGGLSIQSGIAIHAEGPEVPLLGGGALELARGLIELRAPRAAPALIVRRAGELRHGDSLYAFDVAGTVSIEVAVEFAETGPETASWHGDPASFVERIAPARTFGFARDAERLARSGRARHIDPEAVLVFDAHGRALAGRAAEPGELARHKLLDLIGDLYLYGGPPLGRVRARRPGHTATHAVVRQALAEGLLARASAPYSREREHWY